jgi:hypothetical protein
MECGMRISDCGLAEPFSQSAIHNPQSVGPLPRAALTFTDSVASQRQPTEPRTDSISFAES